MTSGRGRAPSARAPAAPDRLWAPGSRLLVVGVFGLMTFVAFEVFAVTTALPVVARDLGAERWYSLAFAATMTTGLVGMTLGGTWADRSGPLRPLVFGGAAFLLGLALCVAAPTMGVFVAGRLLQGIGGGIDSVVLYVVIARSVREELRPRMFGSLTLAWLLPSVVGPLVSGLLVQAVHWRVVFALVLVGSAVSLVMLVGVARRAGKGHGGGSPFDPRLVWAGVAAAALLGLHLSGQQAASALVAGTVASTAVLAAAAVRLLPPGTLRARAGIPRLVLLRALMGGAVSATDIYLPPYLQYELGYAPAVSGLVVAVGALGWAGGAWWQGRSAGDPHRPEPLYLAAALVVCGPLGAALVVGGLLPVAAAAACCVVMGVGMGIAMPRVSSTVMTLSPVKLQGRNGSALQIAESVVTSALVAVAGAVLTASSLGGYLPVYALVGAVALAALGVTLTLRPVRGPVDGPSGEEGGAPPHGGGDGVEGSR
ncbi:MFS transporter [Nocardiopsis prasina]|uniref:MFS transporter n=1 Tax=Nocardiopsis prasina TaxID=2015 RepID=UPI00034A5D17|nr:MFS transporter [Nocardiopsis prasina]